MIESGPRQASKEESLSQDFNAELERRSYIREVELRMREGITDISCRIRILNARLEYLNSKSGKTEEENNLLARTESELHLITGRRELLCQARGVVGLFNLKAAEAIEASVKEEAPGTIQRDHNGTYYVCGHGNVMENSNGENIHYMTNEDGMLVQTQEYLQSLVDTNKIPAGSHVRIISCHIGEDTTSQFDQIPLSIAKGTTFTGTMSTYDHDKNDILRNVPGTEEVVVAKDFFATSD